MSSVVGFGLQSRTSTGTSRAGGRRRTPAGGWGLASEGRLWGDGCEALDVPSAGEPGFPGSPSLVSRCALPRRM